MHVKRRTRKEKVKKSQQERWCDKEERKRGRWKDKSKKIKKTNRNEGFRRRRMKKRRHKETKLWKKCIELANSFFFSEGNREE